MEEKSDFLCRAKERSVVLTERMKGLHSFIRQILGISVTRGAGRAEMMLGKSRRKRRIFGERDGDRSAEIGMLRETVVI